MSTESNWYHSKLEGADEVVEHPAGGPIQDHDKDGSDVKSTLADAPHRASFTFDQLEAACGVLRDYGNDAISAYEHGGDVHEMDYLPPIVRALGLDHEVTI